MAMLFLEETVRCDVQPEIQIFASDIDEGALAVGREGRYPAAIEADLTEERLRRFFKKEDDHYRVGNELRECVLFASHSLLRDPPFSRLSLISCRNLLIYLDHDLQEQVFSIFRYALQPGGHLFLGAAENAEGEHFRTIDRKHRIFQARQTTGQAPYLPDLRFHQPPPILARGTASHGMQRQGSKLSTIHDVHRIALEAFAPPSVLVDEQHRVLHLSETAGRFLQHRGGPPVHDVLQLVRPALHAELSAALYSAFEKNQGKLSAFVPVSFNGTHRRVAVLVHPQESTDDHERLALVTFLDGGAALPVGEVPAEGSESAALVRQLKEELQQTQSRLRAAQEEFEATNEDLRAANEELQSLNEEYRSTAEELETSKEELQSINEELQTVNSELKNKLEEVYRAHSDLENLMAATAIGTLFLDRSLCIQRFTSQVTELFHIKSGDIGRPISDFAHSLDYDRLESDADQVLLDLIPIERVAKSEHGQWFQVRLRPYRTVDDRIEGVVVTFVDITKSKQIEQQLEAARDYAENIVNTVREPLIVLTYGLRVESVNQAFNDTFSIGPQEPEGRPIYELGNRQWDIPELRQALEQVLRENETFENFEVTKDFAQLGQRTMLLNARRLEDTQRILLAIEDITERKKTEQLQDQDRRKNEFLGLLGHELRNPLAAISNSVDLLQMKIGASHELRSPIDRISHQVSHLLRLMDDLLNLTRITSGRIELRKTPLNLANNIADIAAQIQSQIEAGRHHLTLDLPTQPLYVEADPTRLTQIVFNLLSNATHYTEPEGSITLTVERAADDALIRVRDTGIGIEPEQLPHLFEPFSRLQSGTDRYGGGLGLGLALARKLAELHGGSLDVFSAGTGQGSEFTLRLLALPAEHATESASPPGDVQADIPARRILLVDDDETVAKAMAEFLENLDHEVRVVYRGALVVEAAREFAPDLVLLDIGLPDMSGFEVARQLRQEFGSSPLRLVALSGYSLDEDAQQAREAGLDRCLLKPASPDDLKAILREL